MYLKSSFPIPSVSNNLFQCQHTELLREHLQCWGHFTGFDPNLMPRHCKDICWALGVAVVLWSMITFGLGNAAPVMLHRSGPSENKLHYPLKFAFLSLFNMLFQAKSSTVKAIPFSQRKKILIIRYPGPTEICIKFISGFRLLGRGVFYLKKN